MTPKPNPDAQADEQPRSTVYVMVWAVLALMALGYLTLLAIRPDLAASMVVNPPFGSPEGNQGQRAMFRAIAEVQELKKTVTKLQGELAELKSTVTADQQKILELEGRIAAAEARAKAAIPMADATPAAQKTATTHADEAGDGLSGGNVKGQVVEAPAKSKKDARQPAVRAIAAASGPASEAQPPAAAVPASPPSGLLISSGPSLDAMRLTWQLLLETHRSTLRSLEPRTVESPGDPPTYQLVAGPVPSREAANKACERLKAKQARCTVIQFGGQPL